MLKSLPPRDRDGTAEGGARKRVLQKIFECKKAERSGKSLGETARSRRYSRRLKFNWRRNDMILSDAEPHCQERSTMRSDPASRDKDVPFAGPGDSGLRRSLQVIEPIGLIGV